MTGTNAAEGLRAYIDRLERLREEKDEVALAEREVFQEATARGYDPKVMRIMLKERRMDRHALEEHAALIEIYRAALGMLDGQALGEAARRRLSGERSDPAQPNLDLPTKPEDRPAPAEDTDTVETARKKGATAQADGKRVIDNPYPAGDPRRAAWDEGWCQSAGSDGMDVPEAWRRKKKPKKGDGDGGEGES
jgi:uncharacterized protein (UPF0335 family)